MLSVLEDKNEGISVLTELDDALEVYVVSLLSASLDLQNQDIPTYA